MNIALNIDLLVIVLYLAMTIFIGLWYAKRVGTAKEYATGGRHYGAFPIFATVTAAYLGGGYTIGVAEKVFSIGVGYIVVMWGFSIKEILLAKFIVPKMKKFSEAITVADLMGKFYGDRARLFTGIASVLVCAGILGAQIGACGKILNIFLKVDPTWGCVFSAMLIIFYTIKGGLKSVVATDVFHFLVLVVALPLVLIIGTYEIGGWGHLSHLVSTSADKFTDQMGWTTLAVLFLSLFFGETLVPPYFQRLVIGKSNKETEKGVFASSLLSIPFFMVVGLIGLIALELNPGLKPDLALPQVIMDLMPIGMRGLAIAGMLAVILSSADAFLNAAAISLTHDVVRYVKPNLKATNELFSYRSMTALIGFCSIIFAIGIPSVMDILIYAYQFWTPIILVPLVAGIWGFKTSPEQFYVPAGVGLASVFIWQFTAQNSIDSSAEASIIGILTNLLAFICLAYRNKALNVKTERS